MHMLTRSLLGLVICSASSVYAADAPVRSFNLTIVRGAVSAEQRVLKVEKGDAVRVRVTSDAPGELHLHGYRLAAQLSPGTPAELAFTAYATGRYPFEGQGTGAAAKPGAHHGPPPAVIEVQPK